MPNAVNFLKLGYQTSSLPRVRHLFWPKSFHLDGFMKSRNFGVFESLLRFKVFEYFYGTKIKRKLLKEMHNYDLLSLSMGGMFGTTLVVFPTPHFLSVRG
jgi:hypothetical protein